MAFQMVRVQFHEARDQIVAAEILAASRCAAGDVGDQPVADRDGSLHHLVGEHDAGIGENEVGGHVMRSFVAASGRARDAPAR